MYQIDSSGSVVTQPAPAAAATPGWFTNGNPATGTPATILDGDWFNALQAELINVLAAASVTPTKGTNNQVLAALQTLFPAYSRVKNVAPVIAKTNLLTLPANGSWQVTATIIAPCAGFVYATGAVNAAAQFAGSLAMNLNINGSSAAGDSTLLSQTQYGQIAVTAGQTVTVQTAISSGATAPNQNAAIIATALFVPAP